MHTMQLFDTSRLHTTESTPTHGAGDLRVLVEALMDEELDTFNDEWDRCHPLSPHVRELVVDVVVSTLQQCWTCEEAALVAAGALAEDATGAHPAPW